MSEGARPSWGFQLAPRQWRRLAARVREDPGDVTLGAEVFFAIGGLDEEPTYRRLLRAPETYRPLWLDDIFASAAPRAG